MTTFRDLEVWRRSMELSELCYRVTASFPRSELFGLAGQMRRAAVSVAANVAEGHCRRSTRAFMNHVSIALGSNGELSTLIELSQRMGFITREQRAELDGGNELIGRLLYGLHRALSARSARN